MPKSLELRKVKKILKKYGIMYVTGKGRHPKFMTLRPRRKEPCKSAKSVSKKMVPPTSSEAVLQPNASSARWNERTQGTRMVFCLNPQAERSSDLTPLPPYVYPMKFMSMRSEANFIGAPGPMPHALCPFRLEPCV